MAKKVLVPQYLVTSSSHFKKGLTVHNANCRYFMTAYGDVVTAEFIPDGAVNCKICGGKR